MKKNSLVWIVLLMTIFTSRAQVQNSSFEDANGSDLTGWEWTCGAIGDSSAPIGGGNWCIKVNSGNFQGCFPGFAYQKLPAIVNGQDFNLHAWVRAETSPYVGVYFGKINNGVITLLEGDSTSSTSWTYIVKPGMFALGPGDTAVVVLWGGQTGGPVQGYGYFDSVHLGPTAGVESMESTQIRIYPNPVSELLHIRADKYPQTVTIADVHGRIIGYFEVENETTIIDVSDLAPGVYYIRFKEEKIKLIVK